MSTEKIDNSTIFDFKIEIFESDNLTSANFYFGDVYLPIAPIWSGGERFNRVFCLL